MTNIEQKIEISSLFQIYKKLLTSKQQSYLSLYIDEDLSLQEIALEFNISRAAVHDTINKTIESLYNYEQKLNIKKIIDKFKNSNNLEVQKLIEMFEVE